jgi:hypothetical protein
MSLRRATTMLLAVIFAVTMTGCQLFEPAAADLLSSANTKMRSAKSVHLDGTGSLALKGGFAFSFDFKIKGDVQVPDRSRLSVNMVFLGQSIDIETITIGGRSYTRDPVSGAWNESTNTNANSSSGFPTFTPMDPLNSFDLSGATSVVEVDRPVVDGQKTRHFRYSADPNKLKDVLDKSARATPLPYSNPTGVGEVWIRVDDSQIVRQSLKVTLDIDNLGGLIPGVQLPGATQNSAKSTFEMGFDFNFTKHGEAIPQITAPPVGR